MHYQFTALHYTDLIGRPFYTHLKAVNHLLAKIPSHIALFTVSNMKRYSQQDHSAYEMPNFDQTWQSIPGEELFTGGIETNTIINPVFDVELMTNWQIPNPDQFHLSGELFMESAQFPLHAELTTHHCPVPMANHSMQAPLNQGFLSETRSTHQFLQRTFNTGSPSNQTIYPALDQSPCYPAWEQRGVGDVG